MTMTPTNVTEIGNQIKEEFLKQLQNQNVITKELQDEMNKYCIVVAEKGYFGKLWDKIYWTKDDSLTIAIVKVFPDPNDI